MTRWFRMYDELLDDPKVQKLPAHDFRGWVNLLCLASRNDGRLPPVSDIAFALRETQDAVSTLLERLLDGGLIERRSGGADGAHYAPYRWDERQYKSDTSTGRVKRFRERSKTVAETPPETETEETLAKANGASADSDTEFWESAKSFLKTESKNPGALIGKWCRDYGKAVTADALTRAQLERPVQRVPFIEGTLRKAVRARPAVPL